MIPSFSYPLTSTLLLVVLSTVLLCELNYAEGKAVIDAKVDLVDPEVTWYIRKNRDISRSHADLDKDYDFVEAGSQDHSNDRFDDYESPKEFYQPPPNILRFFDKRGIVSTSAIS